MSSFITGDKCILRAWRVSLGGAALAVLRLQSAPDGCGRDGQRGQGPRGGQHRPPPQRPRAARQDRRPHPRGDIQLQGAPRPNAYDHQRGPDNRCRARDYSPGGTAGVQSTATASTPYADADAAERHQLERVHEWHRRHHYGWHGYAWWHRHHRGPRRCSRWSGPRSTCQQQPRIHDGRNYGRRGRRSDSGRPGEDRQSEDRRRPLAGAIFGSSTPGDRVKIVASKSGHYLALREPVNHGDAQSLLLAPPACTWPRRRTLKVPPRFWKAEPAGEGFWSLVNCETEKVMEDRGSEGVVVQSASREGALEQQWRVEKRHGMTAAGSRDLPSLRGRGRGEGLCRAMGVAHHDRSLADSKLGRGYCLHLDGGVP